MLVSMRNHLFTFYKLSFYFQTFSTIFTELVIVLLVNNPTLKFLHVFFLTSVTVVLLSLSL